MGLLDLFKNFKKKGSPPKKSVDVEVITPTIRVPSRGKVSTVKVEFDASCAERILKEFIAFDVETTGLDPAIDRIVEIGAVLFRFGNPAKKFSTLVNPSISIPASASAINHITNTMLKSAPDEKDAYRQLIEFLGNAKTGDILMCAHNASFDFGFLRNTLSRLGYDANLEYLDTLGLARRYIGGLKNYKQSTLESHFGFFNASSHRALSDAENCGRILIKIAGYASVALEEERQFIEKATPSKEELSVCAYIQNMIYNKGGDVEYLRFKKISGNYVDVMYLYSFIRFKFAKKGKYIILERSAVLQANLPIEPCSVSEGGTDYMRIYFSKALDLEPFSDHIFAKYERTEKLMQEYISHSSYAKREVESIIRQMKSLSKNEVAQLLEDEAKGEALASKITVEVENPISRDMVTIYAVHSRVPLSEILNADDWEKGFDAGFKYYEKGDSSRKEGHIEEAILLFDKARFYGYNAPALYTSYALAYRKIKDYDNEIIILEEGISRALAHTGELEARRDKAIKLLYKRQETVRKKEERKQTQATPKEPKQESRKPAGRAILQMTDDGTVIEEFDSISAAVQKTGISSKSIRDAANGVQKHAGGYRWVYKDTGRHTSSHEEI